MRAQNNIINPYTYAIFVAGCALSYFMALSYAYTEFVSDLYGYTGFNSDYNFLRATISSAVIFFLFLGLQREKGVRKGVLSLVAGLFIVPSSVMFSAEEGGWWYYFLVVSGYYVIAITSKFSIPSIKWVPVNPLFFIGGLIFLYVLYFVGVVAKGGALHFNIDISKVYEYRDLSAKNLGGIFSYISPIMTKAVLPVLCGWCLLTKKKWAFAIAVSLGFISFAFTGHKSAAFFPFVVAFLYWFSAKEFLKIFILSLLFLTVVSVLDFWLANKFGHDAWIGSLIARRTLLVPAHIDTSYVAYFSNNPFYFWENSKFSFGLVDRSYEVGAPYQIGSEVYGSNVLGANTGFLGSGFANAGIFGVYLYATLLGLLTAFCRGASNVFGERFIIAVGSVPFIVLITSSDLTTVLLTHGLAALVFLLLFYPENAT